MVMMINDETIRMISEQTLQSFFLLLSLHLVFIGEQKLLIGATDQHVSLIASIDDSLIPEARENTKLDSTLDFSSVLRSMDSSSRNA